LRKYHANFGVAQLSVFREFAEGRTNPVELEANPPSEVQSEGYLREMGRLCDGSEEAISVWAIQAEIGTDTDQM
jgi:hypothetical protein